METYILIVLTFGVLFTALAYYLSPNERTFNQAIKGIWMASAFAIITALVLHTAKAEWLPYTEVFIGVEQPNMPVSPQCKEGMGDTKWTSNLGIEQGLWRKNNTNIYLKYQHHSCAIGYDNKVTDSIGVGVKYRVEWK